MSKTPFVDIHHIHTLPMYIFFHKQLIVIQLAKKSPGFYGIQVFITMFMKAAIGYYPDPVSILKPCFFKIHFNSLELPSGLFS